MNDTPNVLFNELSRKDIDGLSDIVLKKRIEQFQNTGAWRFRNDYSDYCTVYATRKKGIQLCTGDYSSAGGKSRKHKSRKHKSRKHKSRK